MATGLRFSSFSSNMVILLIFLLGYNKAQKVVNSFPFPLFDFLSFSLLFPYFLFHSFHCLSSLPRLSFQVYSVPFLSSPVFYLLLSPLSQLLWFPLQFFPFLFSRVLSFPLFTSPIHSSLFISPLLPFPPLLSCPIPSCPVLSSPLVCLHLSSLLTPSIFHLLRESWNAAVEWISPK